MVQLKMVFINTPQSVSQTFLHGCVEIISAFKRTRRCEMFKKKKSSSVPRPLWLKFGILGIEIEQDTIRILIVKCQNKITSEIGHLWSERENTIVIQVRPTGDSKSETHISSF